MEATTLTALDDCTFKLNLFYRLRGHEKTVASQWSYECSQFQEGAAGN